MPIFAGKKVVAMGIVVYISVVLLVMLLVLPATQPPQAKVLMEVQLIRIRV